MKARMFLFATALIMGCGEVEHDEAGDIEAGGGAGQTDPTDDGDGGERPGAGGGGGGGGGVDDGAPGSLRDCGDGLCDGPDGGDDDPDPVRTVIVPPCNLGPAWCGGGDDGDGGCRGSHMLDLLAGRYMDVGDVLVETSRKGVTIEVTVDEPWSLDLLHAYAGLDIPAINPGAYPYEIELDHEQAYSIYIPIDEIGATCGDLVLVALHADVSQPANHGGACIEETAWAEPELVFESGWGGFSEMTVCCGS